VEMRLHVSHSLDYTKELPHLLVCFLLEHSRQYNSHRVRLGVACRRQAGAEQAPSSCGIPATLQLHSGQQACNCATGIERGKCLQVGSELSSKLSKAEE